MSGVKYQEVHRANAEEMMSSGIHGRNKRSSPRWSDMSGDEWREEATDQRRRLRIIGKLYVFPGCNLPTTALRRTQCYCKGKSAVSRRKEKQNCVQEELYIHSKLIIYRIVICGSSNINDRSQLGFRDSELSIESMIRVLLPQTPSPNRCQSSYILPPKATARSSPSRSSSE